MNIGSVAILCLFTAALVQAQVSTPQPISGEYIVKFKKSKTSVAAGQKAVSRMGPAIAVKAVFAGSRMMHLKVNSDSARDALYSDPDVEFIEPNYILSINPVDVSALGSPPEPSDAYNQSNSNAQVNESWGIQKPYNEGTKTVVAIIDTGLDKDHLLFKDSGSVWENTVEKNGSPGIDDDGNGYVDDINGWNFVGSNANAFDDNDHGTHVAGIVLGVGQDVFASPVRESKIRIMPLKFLDSSGAGSTASAIAAIYYAVDNGAKVINNSWGGPSYSQSLHEAYTYAYNQGVVIVSAAGNSNTNNDVNAMYPSNLDSPNNISVLAATDYDGKASFSNYGATTVNIAAPGVAILSSVPGSGCLAPGCFQMMSGTSMAAPFVTGLVALITREAPQLSAYQIRSIVVGAVDTISAFSDKVSTGGRVNAYKAVLSAKAQSAASPWSPVYSPDYKSSRSTASDSASTGAAPAGCGLVKAIIDSAGSGPGGGASVGDLATIFSLLLLPLVIALNLRARSLQLAGVANRRFYDRYMVSKRAALQVCGQIINITTDDISLGGVSFKGDADLVRGQIIKIKFAENSEEQIDAEVVWCSKRHEYGLKFINISEKIKFEIQSWTKGLAPAN